MDLKKYIAESEKRYEYRFKTVVPLDDYAMDRVELVLMKHQPLDIGRPKKTMYQSNPLDFKNIETGSEVWIVDFVLGLPASSSVVAEQIRHSLGAKANQIIVRGWNDPTEIESDRINAGNDISAEADKLGLTLQPLLTDPNYNEADPGPADLYGNSANSKFLNYLKKVQDERPDGKVDAPSPLFKWLDMPKEESSAENYNANIPGAPTTGDANGPQAEYNASGEGNLQDTKRKYQRQYGKNGTRVVLSRDTADIRKDGK